MTTTSEPFTVADVVTAPNGAKFLLEIHGTVDVTRGPLGRFLDLYEQIRAEGLDPAGSLPAAIPAVLDLAQRPTKAAYDALNAAFDAACRSAAEMARTLSEVAQVVAEYDPVMEGPAAAVAAMARIVDALTDSALGPEIQGSPPSEG